MIEYIQNMLSQVSFPEAVNILEPLVVFAVGMVVYSVFIFKFYKFIGKRDTFPLKKKTGFRRFVNFLQYVFLFPVTAVIWFFIISVFLSMLSSVLTVGDIFKLSAAILVTIRISAYISENLSMDIAKMIPFALLATFLLEISKFSVDVPIQVLHQIPSVMNVLIYYFIFIVILELVLKILLAIKHAVIGEKKSAETKQ